MSYATAAQLKAWIGIEDTVDDTQLQVILDAATRAIDHKCSRSFTLSSAATKYFYPTSEWLLDVPDLVSVTSIKLDTVGDRTYATTLTTNEYELLPYTDDNGIPSVRYQQVRIWPLSSHAFTRGRLVQVVGNFGYVVSGAAPADVQQFCLILAARIWKRHETPLGILGATDLGQFERIGKEDPEAYLLAPYIRGKDWVAV